MTEHHTYSSLDVPVRLLAIQSTKSGSIRSCQHAVHVQMSSMITVPISVTYLKIVKLCLLG